MPGGGWVREGRWCLGWLTDGGPGEERRGGYIPHSEALRGSLATAVAVVAAMA